MRVFRRNRLVAILAIFAFFLGTSLYLAHTHGPDAAVSHSAIQCDLCLQFSGTAGTPACGNLSGKPVLFARVPPPREQQVYLSFREGVAALPRAPPAERVI